MWAATFARVAELALGDAMPLPQNAYPIALAQAPIRRALQSLVEERD